MSDVQITVDLPYPAEVVWSALTQRRLMSEWFLPTDLAPVAGGLYRVFPPPGMTGFAAPFDVDVLEVVVPQRLLQRWRGEQLHTEMLWELTPDKGGCRLRVVQSGFLGLQGDRRRAELLEAYETLFQERLPALLARLALDDVLPPPPVRVPLKMPNESDPPGAHRLGSLAEPDSATSRWWPGLGGMRLLRRIPERNRLRLLSALGAVVLTVLVATAMATMVFTPPSAPMLKPDHILKLAPQPGAGTPVPPSPTPSQPPATRSPSPAASTSAPPANPAGLTAAYRTAESYSLSYIGSITIKAGPSQVNGWAAVIELPPGATVTSAWDQVNYDVSGQRVTFTSKAHRRIEAGTTFTFSFQVGDSESGPRGPLSCAVNGVPCSGF